MSVIDFIETLDTQLTVLLRGTWNIINLERGCSISIYQLLIY